MTVLLAHLMKCVAQKDREHSSTWRATIAEQRNQLIDLLQDSPSIRRLLEQEMPVLLARALKQAAEETRMTDSPLFTRNYTYTGSGNHLEMLLQDWFPGRMEDLFD